MLCWQVISSIYFPSKNFQYIKDNVNKLPAYLLVPQATASMGLLLAQDVLLGASEDHLQDPPRDDIY